MMRRILHKLDLHEISAVDDPCQEGARMVIMKRQPTRVEVLAARVDALRKSVDALNEQLDQF